MRVILACAGSGSQWGDHLGLPKQLAPVEGEPILHRAVRLWGRYSDDLVIVAPPDDLERFAVPGARVEPADQDPQMGKMGRYWSSRHLWNTDGRTLVLFGDVFWDETTVERVANFGVKGWRWIARLDGNELTGKDRPEGFGCSFWPNQHDEMRAAVVECARLWREKVTKRCLGFDHWQLMQGAKPEKVHPFPDYGRCITVDGTTEWTDDIDRPEEYRRLILRRAEHAPVEPGLVSVVVPMRGSDPHRLAAWEWVRRQVPDEWEIVTADDGKTEGAFNRAAALIHGIGRARGDILVPVDCDCWSARIGEAVDHVRRHGGWCHPHDRLVRFTPEATRAVLDGAAPADVDHEANWEEKPYRQRAGAGPLAIDRSLALAIPPDQRFDGWGGEENAWGWALSTLHGEVHRLQDTGYHLWHPPQPRMSRHVGNPANHALRDRYRKANGKPDRMRVLVAEARGEAAQSSQRPHRLWRHTRTGRIRSVPAGSYLDAKLYPRRPEWERADA